MTTKQILLAAADHIEKVGHFKNHYFPVTHEEGSPRFLTPEQRASRPCCLFGALWVTMGADSVAPHSHCDPAKALRKAIAPDNPDFGLVAWNDAPERTQKEVVAAFRRAAALCE